MKYFIQEWLYIIFLLINLEAIIEIILVKKIYLNNLYCPKYLNQSLQGYNVYDLNVTYSYYVIQFFPCVNSSENNNMCAPKTNISKLLHEFGVTFIMQDIVLSPNDYEKPVKPIPKEISF